MEKSIDNIHEEVNIVVGNKEMDSNIPISNQAYFNNISFNNVIDLFNIPKKDIKTISPLVFAYIGDSVYDLIIKSILVGRGNIPVNKLHKEASSLVKAEAQVRMYEAIKAILNEEESGIFRRGRNAKSYTTAKNATKIDYRMATGYEALIGYLYMNDEIDRIYELVKIGLKEVE